MRKSDLAFYLVMIAVSCLATTCGYKFGYDHGVKDGIINQINWESNMSKAIWGHDYSHKPMPDVQSN